MGRWVDYPWDSDAGLGDDLGKGEPRQLRIDRIVSAKVIAPQGSGTKATVASPGASYQP